VSNDPLAPARGIILGCLAGAVPWAAVALLAPPVVTFAGFGVATVGVVAWALYDGGRPLHEDDPEPRYWVSGSPRVLREGES
jgi:hypothetical protein